MTSLPLLLQWLAQHARPFLVRGNNIKVLYSPDLFFKTLKEGVLKAKRRVVISSLYLGTGSKEKEIVECFHRSLSDNSRKDLKCTLLVDHLRGSRGHPNSRTMVQDLVTQFHDKFSLGLYHTPNLRGIFKALCPERFNEVMGLQHMKIFIFDDDVMLSGSNLSHDYFVNRQDRYMLFRECKELADFFSDVVSTTMAHSYTLDSQGSTKPPSAVSFSPLLSAKAASAFKISFRQAMMKLTVPTTSEHLDLGEELDTIVFPLLQIGFCGIRQDEMATEGLLSGLVRGEAVYLASGYFNLPPTYTRSMLGSEGSCYVMAASPQANGFYGAKGMAGHVPGMYVHFAKMFLEAISQTGNEARVKYLEYERPGWTFHGKGMWYYLAGDDHPSVTLIGSSNYGHRSLTRDVEAQIALITMNAELKAGLHKERTRMYNFGRELNLEQAKMDPRRTQTFLERIGTSLLKPHV